jgi:uncharacterized membrane protein YfcA
MFDLLFYVALFLMGLGLGFVGTTTGGSALIMIPVMISFGVPTHAAIAQARFATLGTMVSGLRMYHREKKVDYSLALISSIFGVSGAILGALTLIDVSDVVLKQIMGYLTLGCVLLTFIKKYKPEHSPLNNYRRVFGYFLFFIVGFIGGFFGAQALLATYVLLFVFNKSMTESIGTRKVLGIMISLTSLAVYGMNDLIDWKQSAILVSGTLLGGTFGSAYALKMGDDWAEKLFNVAVIALAIKMILG